MPAGCSWDLGRERRKVDAPRRAITWAGDEARRGLPAHALVEFILRFRMDGIEFARLVEQLPGGWVSKHRLIPGYPTRVSAQVSAPGLDRPVDHGRVRSRRAERVRMRCEA
jgi:hypothetical protein